MQVRKWLISGEINYNVCRICSLTLLPPEVLIPTPITLSVTGRRYFADIRGLTFNHCDVGLIGLQSYQIWRNNAKSEPLRRSRSFKVTDVGTNRKPICDFLLVINTNWHPISYHFEVIADYWLNFGHFAFLSPLWGLKYNACCSA